MKLTASVFLLAAALFVPLFSLRAIGPFDFWWWMSANLLLLCSLAAGLDRSFGLAIREDFASRRLTKVALGLGSALVLYGVFFVGNILARKIFSFAGDNISAVYDFREGASPWRIALLMTLIIGPGEELFWRGFLQRRLQTQAGPWRGLALATVLYAAVHIASWNPILVLAALVCGLFWGLLYLRYQSMLLNMLSHLLWDVAIFLLLPVT